MSFSIEQIKDHVFISHVRLLQIDYQSLFSPGLLNLNNRGTTKSPKVIKSSLSNLNFPNFTDSIQPDLVPKKREKQTTNINLLLISNLKQEIILNDYSLKC